MRRFVVTTSDRELVHELWEIESDNLTIEEPLQKSIEAKDIAIYINAGYATYKLINTILAIIAKHSTTKRNHTKTKVYAVKSETEIKELIESFKDVVDLVFDEEE